MAQPHKTDEKVNALSLGKLKEGPRAGAFGAYIHWPFCAAKCPYCDFNSHVARETVDEARFLAAFQREMAYWAEQQQVHAEKAALKNPLPKLSSIFFGGGTPSLMSPQLVEGVLEALQSHWMFEESIEINLEANPQSVDAGRFRSLRLAGINRLSMGVQSFDDASLKALGRLHDVKEARRAIDIAQSTFERFSFDLIYGRPGQSLAQWEGELQEAFRIGTKHLSLYQLTIEPNTPYKKLYDAGKLIMPDEDLAVDFFQMTQGLCASAGLPSYEVSNHAVPGEEARHNLLYWRYGDFLGLGAGAHGRLTLGGQKFATIAAALPTEWLTRVEANDNGGISFEEIDAETQAIEMVLMGIRLKEGLPLAELEQRTGYLINAECIESQIKDGLLARGQRQGNAQLLRPTAKGVEVLNYLAGQLVEGLQPVS